MAAGCASKKDSGDDTKINKRDFDDKPSLKRKAPKTPAPLKVKDVEFSAPVTEMGFVVAKDLASNKEIWKKQVYKIEYDKNLEKDVQDVFIDSLWLSGNNVMVRNEKGELYELDPSTHGVTKK